MSLHRLAVLIVLLIAVPAAAKKKAKPRAKPKAAAEAQPAVPADARDEAMPDLDFGITWVKGPGVGKMANAELTLPAGVRFAGPDGAKKMLEMTENTPSGDEFGIVMREPVRDAKGEIDFPWWAVFEFQESGYVSDDDKDEIDADELLSGFREGTEQANEARRSRGWNELHVTGWAQPPHYDDATHNLVWAMNVTSDTGTTVNYNVRLLGRHGVMSATLLVAPEKLATALPEFTSALGTFSYSDGNRYGDYRQGDKIAEYGLIGLMAGGAAAVAFKSGLLTKLWKPLILGFAALAGGAKKIWAKVRGRSAT